MKIIHHLVVSIVFAIILYPLFGVKSFLLLLTGVLIDFDHFIWYSLKFKNFNIKEFLNFFKAEKQKKYMPVLCPFHTVEFLFLNISFVWINEIFLILLIGTVIHFTSDVLLDIFCYHNFKGRSWSIVHSAYRKILKIKREGN